MNDRLRQLPKAELHVHIEAMIEGPEATRALAEKNNIELDPELFTPDGKSYAYNDFLDLVTVIYQAAASVLQTKDDYREVVTSYQQRAAAEGSVYTEMIACPGECDRKPTLSYRDMINGSVAGIRSARASHGIEGRINVTFERHRPGAEAQKDAEMILSYPHPYIVGLDIAGGEKEGDAPQFLDTYNYVAKEFYNRLFEGAENYVTHTAFIDSLMTKFALEEEFRPTLENYFQKWSEGGLELGRRLHAIEGAGPDPNGWDFLKFNPDRGGHLIRAEEDPVLLGELVQRGITFELCPTSNVLLVEKYATDFSNYPGRAYYDAGAKVTINTDDPGLLGCTIGGEYEIAHNKLGFTLRELAECTRNAIQAAYVDEKTRKKILNKVQDMAFLALAPPKGGASPESSPGPG